MKSKKMKKGANLIKMFEAMIIVSTDDDFVNFSAPKIIIDRQMFYLPYSHSISSTSNMVYYIKILQMYIYRAEYVKKTNLNQNLFTYVYNINAYTKEQHHDNFTFYAFVHACLTNHLTSVIFIKQDGKHFTVLFFLL